MDNCPTLDFDYHRKVTIRGFVGVLRVINMDKDSALDIEGRGTLYISNSCKEGNIRVKGDGESGIQVIDVGPFESEPPPHDPDNCDIIGCKKCGPVEVPGQIQPSEPWPRP